MANLAIDLPVFVASPGDVAKERTGAERAIEALGRESTAHGLMVRPFLWDRHWRPAAGRPQTPLNIELRNCELVIVILWTRLGTETAPGSGVTGTVQELLLSLSRARHGRLDDVMIYLRMDPPAGGWPESRAAVEAVCKELESSGSALLWKYSGDSEFNRLVARHLDTWVAPWRSVPAVCRATLQQSTPHRVRPEVLGENRLTEILNHFRPERAESLSAELSRAALRNYQTQGPNGASSPVQVAPGLRMEAERYVNSQDDLFSELYLRTHGRHTCSPNPLVLQHSNLHFADAMWFCFFCAYGLERAILDGDVQVVSTRPFINEIHQYLAALIVGNKPAIVARLREWLESRDSAQRVSPIARNFSAFVLGMLNADDAIESLLDAIEYDTGTEVRLYATMSIGRIRARRSLPQLLTRWSQEQDANLKLVTGQAICRIVGIAEYPF